MILVACVWTSPEQDPVYLPLDDSEYPYANLPRLVIETDYFSQIRNQDAKHPARLQIYGEKAPISEIMELSIKGRGYSSFSGMPKPSYTIKFSEKKEILNMPIGKEWALIANSVDRSLLRNFITYKLYKQLSNRYSPRAEFVELFLNREYQGIYLLTETIKAEKNRVNIPNDENYYLVEKGKYYKNTDTFIRTKSNRIFIIKSDNKNSPTAIEHLKIYLDSLEKILQVDRSSIDKYIDIDDFIAYYWIQEFSKNYDGNFYKSIYFTIENNQVLKFGPVWDFDIAYGNTTNKSVNDANGWYVRDSPWNRELLSEQRIYKKMVDFWKQNLIHFESLQDTLTKYSLFLQKATINEFNRWPVLKNTGNKIYSKDYNHYNDAVSDLIEWINKRIQWINLNLEFENKALN